MNTREIGREQVSALADGELDEYQLDLALTWLRQEGSRSDWDIYHQIGDLLRSKDMAVVLSPEFSARMAARLEREPTIVAPGNRVAYPKRIVKSKRWAIPGILAATAMAGVAFIGAPQLMVALSHDSSPVQSPEVAALASNTSREVIVAAAAVPDGVVLRDPRVDDYLLAHQRFSPSLYSTAQFARSATFAIESSK